MTDQEKEEEFEELKQKINNLKPCEVVDNKFDRAEKVNLLGNWLIEKERFNDVIWLIDKFIDDPDPTEPEKYVGDPIFNYHKKIERGEDPLLITTVLGHLAWIIQKLALQQKYISKAFKYTKKLLEHKNLYVKLQAIYPLIEIAARRQWLEGYGKRPYKGEYKDFKIVVFNLIEIVKENPNYKVIAKLLCHVFFYYKDLSTEEANEVLETLKITPNSSGLFIYFAVFRKRHYLGLVENVSFDPEIFNKKLKDLISISNDFEALRAGIIFNFWELLEKNKDEFENVKPYIDLAVQQPYQSDVCEYLQLIIEDWINKKPGVCIPWYESILSSIRNFIVERPEEFKKQGGLSIMSLPVVEAIAKYDLHKLITVMEQLVQLWKAGVYIADIKSLFESFKLLQDEEEKNEAKIKFNELYSEMKEINPHLVEIEWD